ncbi:MAG: hypothetical protein U0325_32615 [Polyangiales bacterium]
MTDPLMRAHGRGCVAQVLILGASVALVLGFVALAVGAASLAPGDGVSRVAVFGGVFFVCVTALAVGALSFAASRAKVLDAGFARLGIAGSGSLINLREYHGGWQGRAVDALYSRRGPMLDLTVQANVHGALAVGTRTAAGEVLRGAFGMTEVRLADPAFAGLVVSSADPAWAARMLSTPALRELALRATHDPTGRELRVFALRPGAVRLTRRYFHPDAVAGEVPAMVELLAAAGRAAEAQPPPAVPVALTEMERLARAAPGALGVKIALALVGVVLLVTGICAAGMLATVSTHPGGSVPGASSPLRRRGR